jgi:hypothetical protein
MATISQTAVAYILLSCQAGMSGERQAEPEHYFEKTKPICRMPK